MKKNQQPYSRKISLRYWFMPGKASRQRQIGHAASGKRRVAHATSRLQAPARNKAFKSRAAFSRPSPLSSEKPAISIGRKGQLKTVLAPARPSLRNIRAESM
jgi:hypothetical protein